MPGVGLKLKTSVVADEQRASANVEVYQEPGVPTLWSTSLVNLAKAIGKDDGTKLAMYLNIPTTKLMSIRLGGVAERETEDFITANLLIYWKLMRQTAKEKHLIADLKQALTKLDRSDLADVIEILYQNKQEMTAKNLPEKQSPAPEPTASAA